MSDLPRTATPGPTARILSVSEAAMLAQIKRVFADYRYGGTADEKARALLELFISSKEK